MNPNTLLPTLPVFGWDSLKGRRESPLPCLLDHENLTYTTSGRAAILLALERLRVGHGDRVLVPTYHCPTMVAPVVARGAEPEFYPLDASGAPVLDWIAARDPAGIRAILVAHLFGIPQSLAALRAWCDAHRVALIEDCAHCLFGSVGDRPIGRWGDFAIASLPKFLPVPEGGCLAINCAMPTVALARRSLLDDLKAGLDILDIATAYGRLPGLNRTVRGTLAALRRLRGERYPTNEEVDARGGPVTDSMGPDGDDFRLDLERAHHRLTHPSRLMASHLPRERIAAHRRSNYAQLAARFAGRVGLHALRPNLPGGCAPYVFPLWVDQPDPGYAELRRRHIPVFRWDRLWPGTPAIESDQGTLWSHHVLQLACHQDLAEADLDRYVAIVLDVYSDPPSADKPTNARQAPAPHSRGGWVARQ